MKIRQSKSSILMSIVSIVILIFLDQWTKSAAIAGLSEDIILIKGVLQLHYLENTGAAFSILTGQLWLFYILTPVLCALILWIFMRIPAGEARFIWLDIVCVLLMAGAAGNYIDRLRLHYVVDFIYFSLIDFPVFNVADIYVTCATFMLVVLVIFFYKEDELAMILPKGRAGNEANEDDDVNERGEDR